MTLLTLPETTSRRLTRIYAAGNTTQTYQVTKKKMTMETTNSKTAPIVQEKDQNQVTLDLMRRMRLTGMANAFEESLTSTMPYSYSHLNYSVGSSNK